VAASDILRERILREGPISFEVFMETALYHPEFGYYRRQRDPFGRDGDFYTATQLRPYGVLLRAVFDSLTPYRAVVDIGAGRGQLSEAFREWRYIPVESGDSLPEPLDGIIFANELFDALPCRAFGASGESRVAIDGGRFVWTQPPIWEECPRGQVMLKAMSACLRRGFLVVIDYGYNEHERESRFPRGSLMSYRNHSAGEDVLDSPGERDITFHVNFTRLIADAEQIGWKLLAKDSLRTFLMRAGEKALEESRRAGPEQLKTLLFGLGERFEALIFERR
jgi:SAM-dependent MidA family methyltransferase